MKKKIIFDTDLGCDCDDVTALDLLISAHKAGECELIGVTYSAWNRTAPAATHAILKQHGVPEIPIGRLTIQPSDAEKETRDKNVEGMYADGVAERFGDGTVTYENTIDAIRLIRLLLTKNEDVTIVATGSLANLSSLFKSEPDDISPLNGIDLVKKSVAEIAIMACNFWHENCKVADLGFVSEDGTVNAVSEWNIFCDIPAAQYTFANCPVKLVCSPFELGFNMITGKPMYEKGLGETPDSLSFKLHKSENGQHSWDPATALYGIYGSRPWFFKTIPGTIFIADDGTAHFSTKDGGLHTVLQCAMSQEAIATEIDSKIMRLFD